MARKLPISVSRRLLTAREVATLLGIHLVTVYRWAAEGRIPSIKLGNGSLRFLPDHIEAFLSERMVGAA